VGRSHSVLPGAMAQAPRYSPVKTNVELRSLYLAPTAAGARSRHILEQSRLRKAEYIRTGQYQMVKQSHLDRSQ